MPIAEAALLALLIALFALLLVAGALGLVLLFAFAASPPP